MSDDVGDRWSSWRRATESVLARVAADVTRATGLSDADFAVLSRLDEAGGQQRQSELGQALAWPRARVSTQLTRMADRGLVARRSAGDAVLVTLTREGAAELADAAPVHAAAVRRHLLDPLDTGQLAVLDVALTRWDAPGAGAPV